MSIIDEYQKNCAPVTPETILIEGETGILNIESNYTKDVGFVSAVEEYRLNPKGTVLFMSVTSGAEQGYLGLTISQAEEIIAGLQHMVDYIEFEAKK